MRAIVLFLCLGVASGARAQSLPSEPISLGGGRLVLGCTVVDFPNTDKTYHNVFSLSKAKRFDLGRYAAGRSKAIRFDRPGVVRVFCDIHSHMNAFVLVVSHPFFSVTEPDGRFRLGDVPPGTHTVVGWYEGESRVTRPVTVPPGTIVDLELVIP